MTEKVIMPNERIMSLLLELCARLENYKPVDNDELAKHYQVVLDDIKKTTDYFDRFVIKGHYENMKVTDVRDEHKAI